MYIWLFCWLEIRMVNNMQGSFTSTGLVVSSKLPRFSDQYTLTIDSADPQSISAGKSVQFTKSVTQWSLSFCIFHTRAHTISFALRKLLILFLYVYSRLTKDGVLVEGLFWKDVEALVKEYTEAGEPKKKRWSSIMGKVCCSLLVLNVTFFLWLKSMVTWFKRRQSFCLLTEDSFL